MKLETWALSALVVALSVSVMPLLDVIQSLKEQETSERSVTSLVIGVASTSGIDTSGRLIDDANPTTAKRFVLFAIRHSTLEADVAVWTDVAKSLSDEPDVHFIGYCDGLACAEALSRRDRTLPFRVLAHGQPAPFRSVLNHDEKGESVIADGAMRMLRPMVWRNGGQAPVDLARAVLR